jgi:hypothetical protein
VPAASHSAGRSPPRPLAAAGRHDHQDAEGAHPARAQVVPTGRGRGLPAAVADQAGRRARPRRRLLRRRVLLRRVRGGDAHQGPPPPVLLPGAARRVGARGRGRPRRPRAARGPRPAAGLPRPVPAGRGARRGALHHDAPRRAADVRGLQRRARAAGEPGRGVPGARRVHGPGPPGPAVGGHGGEGRAPAPLRAWPRRRRRRPGARAPRGGPPRPPAATVGAGARREDPRLRGRGQVRGVRGAEFRGVRRVRRQPQGVRRRARRRAVPRMQRERPRHVPSLLVGSKQSMSISAQLITFISTTSTQ